MQLEKKSKWIKITVTIPFIGFILYMSITLFFYLMQDQITFMPQSISEDRLNYIRTNYDNVEEITLRVNDEIYVHGWLVKNSDREPSPLLIYFGGNAEEVSHIISQINNSEFPRSVLLMNYRGYGLSDGAPSETAMFHDALEIYDYISARDDVDEHKIAVLGRSMGTGVAVYLAHERDVDQALLVSPYDSLTKVAQGRYPFLPVAWLLNHHFDNISRAPEIDIPLLTLIATEDRVIPPDHSKRLIEKWQGPASYSLFEGYGHNNIQVNSRYWEEIISFLEESRE
ncbi:pimeloyl-ACP methyl ester carboxylesterase [Evansella vedderi]|uniref:Pimeloyl-ACP methyl ester carboxylesterase n=1 Tax=Evansella vedderi TaxID=38282 RepID=A0ABT9ZTU7_9BACI|nr:alpha/beta fold hydrolase [Evansella vedderi]MDQ0254671.1 pimeloyl-ACP methyl ester carboxylesterase [Evansella vedderi]